MYYRERRKALWGWDDRCNAYGPVAREARVLCAAVGVASEEDVVVLGRVGDGQASFSESVEICTPEPFGEQ